MSRFIRLLLLRVFLAWRENHSAALPVFPSLLPTTTTTTTTPLGPTEEFPGSQPLATLFNQQNNTDLRSQVGTTAVLHCIAHNVGENTVSWIRRRDYHLLTVGSQTYSSDDRFQVRYVKQENDWQLHIRYVQVRDEGIYECQVSSHPPVSLFSSLHVLEATAEILGGPEKYMRVGSSLRLVCVLRDNTQPPSYVFWYHGHHMINYQVTREVRVENSGGLSVLFLDNVRPADSGNYTCSPSNTRPAYISIHVLKGGETPAAIHSAAGRSCPSLLVPLLLLGLVCTVFNPAGPAGAGVHGLHPGWSCFGWSTWSSARLVLLGLVCTVLSPADSAGTGLHGPLPGRQFVCSCWERCVMSSARVLLLGLVCMVFSPSASARADLRGPHSRCSSWGRSLHCVPDYEAK